MQNHMRNKIVETIFDRSHGGLFMVVLTSRCSKKERKMVFFDLRAPPEEDAFTGAACRVVGSNRNLMVNKTI